MGQPLPSGSFQCRWGEVGEEKTGKQRLVKCPVVCDGFRKVGTESGDVCLDDLTALMGPERVRMSAEAWNRRGFPEVKGVKGGPQQQGRQVRSGSVSHRWSGSWGEPEAELAGLWCR